MSTSKKIVKFIAEALAIILIALLVYGLSYFIYGLSFVFGNNNKYHDSILLINNNEIRDLNNYSFNIKTEKTSVIIKSSDVFNVSTNNKNIGIEYNKDTNTINIMERKLLLFNFLDSYDMTIYLPDALFKEINIDTNAGNIISERFSTNKLNLTVGSGKVQIDSLVVYKKAVLRTGIGNVNISGKHINNLDLSSGIGQTNIKSNLSGKNVIEGGVGNIELNLNNDENNYSFEVEKGIGDIILNGDVKSDGVYGDGPHSIKCESNIGKITITTNNQEKEDS